MPCHHTLEGYLAEYIERARLADAGRVPLFQAIKVVAGSGKPWVATSVMATRGAANHVVATQVA